MLQTDNITKWGLEFFMEQTPSHLMSILHQYYLKYLGYLKKSQFNLKKLKENLALFGFTTLKKRLKPLDN